MYRVSVSVLVLALALTLAACSDDDSQPQPDAYVQQDAAQNDAAQNDAFVQNDAAVTGCQLPPRDFWVYDLSVMPPDWLQVPATCRAEGTHGILYVADDIWEVDMDQADVDGVLVAWDHATPADPTRGIYELTTTAFGEPTDVDANDRVILFFSELPSYGGSQFDGYIRAEDVLGGTHSNGAEMFYADGVRNDPAGEYMLGVIAHEFTHLIHLNHDLNEESWLEETLAETAMVLCGYLGDLQTWVANDFATNPNQTLTQANPQFNYGAGFLFGTYLLERFGVDFLTALVNEQTDGVVAVENTLANEGHPESFGEVLGDWAMASFLDAPGIAGGPWGYQAFAVPTFDRITRTVPTTITTMTAAPHAARYFVFELSVAAGSYLELSLTSTQWADLAIRYAVYPDGDPAAATVGAFTMTAQTDILAIDNVGGTDDRVVLAVTETGGVQSASFEIDAAFP
jgi:hypothetical protein